MQNSGDLRVKHTTTTPKVEPKRLKLKPEKDLITDLADRLFTAFKGKTKKTRSNELAKQKNVFVEQLTTERGLDLALDLLGIKKCSKTTRQLLEAIEKKLSVTAVPVFGKLVEVFSSLQPGKTKWTILQRKIDAVLGDLPTRDTKMHSIGMNISLIKNANCLGAHIHVLELQRLAKEMNMPFKLPDGWHKQIRGGDKSTPVYVQMVQLARKLGYRLNGEEKDLSMLKDLYDKEGLEAVARLLVADMTKESYVSPLESTLEEIHTLANEAKIAFDPPKKLKQAVLTKDGRQKVFDEFKQLARKIGYTEGMGPGKRLGDLEALNRDSGLLVVAHLLMEQLRSYDIQARGLQEIFEGLDIQKLRKTVVEQEKLRSEGQLYIKADKLLKTLQEKKVKLTEQNMKLKKQICDAVSIPPNNRDDVLLDKFKRLHRKLANVKEQISDVDKQIKGKNLRDNLQNKQVELAKRLETVGNETQNDKTAKEILDLWTTKVELEKKLTKVNKQIVKEGKKAILWTKVTVENTGLVQTFFKNLKGNLEYILVYMPDTPSASGKFEEYSISGTASDLRDLAHLALKRTQITYKGRKQRSQKIKMWEALLQLGVRNIPKLYGTRKIDKDFVVFAENFKDGEMADYTKDILGRGTNEEKREGLEELFHLAAPSLLETLIDMHQGNYIHRDIKSENMLIKMNTETEKIERIVTTDFGFTKQLKKGKKTMKTNRGSPVKIAPEVYSHKRSGKPADIWATACTLLETRYGLLFHGSIFELWPIKVRPEIKTGNQQKFDELVLSYINLATRKTGKEKFHLDAYDKLLLKMLQIDPKKRLTAQEAYDEYQKL